MTRRIVLLALGLLLSTASSATGQRLSRPDTITMSSGTVPLRGIVWRPPGHGPFPAILVMHGSGRRPFRVDLSELGSIFARHGYVLLFVFRRGQGLSADRGANITEVLERQLADSGLDAFNRLQLHLLERDHLQDAHTGLERLRSLREVDGRRIGIVGHSFGGSIAMLLAEGDSTLRAVVNFGGAAASWERSPALRERLLTAARRSTVPTLFVQAANDYSVAPSRLLAAEMQRVGRQNRVKVYPAFGQSSADGHSIIYRAPSLWEADVFSFLDEHVGHGARRTSAGAHGVDPDSAGAAREKLGVVFDPSAVRVGDRIAGLTISRRDVKVAGDGTTQVGTIQFRGEVQLSGRTVRHPESDVRSVCFEADSVSAARLPRWAGDRRRPWFCFANLHVAIARLAPPGADRAAEIVVDGLTINRGLSDEVNSARLIRVVRRGPERGQGR